MDPRISHKRKRDDDDDGDRLHRRQREFPPAHALVLKGSALSLSFPGRLRPVTRDDLDSALSDLSDVKFDDLRILDLSPTFICPPLTKPRFDTLNELNVGCTVNLGDLPPLLSCLTAHTIISPPEDSWDHRTPPIVRLHLMEQADLSCLRLPKLRTLKVTTNCGSPTTLPMNIQRVLLDFDATRCRAPLASVRQFLERATGLVTFAISFLKCPELTEGCVASFPPHLQEFKGPACIIGHGGSNRAPAWPASLHRLTLLRTFDAPKRAHELGSLVDLLSACPYLATLADYAGALAAAGDCLALLSPSIISLTLSHIKDPVNLAHVPTFAPTDLSLHHCTVQGELPPVGRLTFHNVRPLDPKPALSVHPKTRELQVTSSDALSFCIARGQTNGALVKLITDNTDVVMVGPGIESAADVKHTHRSDNTDYHRVMADLACVRLVADD